MATLRKRKTKKGFIYDVDFYYRHKRYITCTGNSERRIALRILNNIQAKIALGTFNLAEYEQKDITLSKFFTEEYFPFAQSFKKESTIINERVVARTFVGVLGPNRNLRSIDQHSLDRWKTSLVERVSPTTYNIHRRFLHAAFNVAVKWGYLEHNPIKGLVMLKVEEMRNNMTGEVKHFLWGQNMWIVDKV
jgi:hypothetical protein